MRLGSFAVGGVEQLGVCVSSGLVPMAAVNQRVGRQWPLDMLSLIQSGGLGSLCRWYAAEGRDAIEGMDRDTLPHNEIRWAPLYRHPGKIWGIGLNYEAHARDLSEKTPTDYPASFIKPSTTLIGHGDTIRIPIQSRKTTAEAELGVIIGRSCKDVDRADLLSAVAGFTTVIDVTAEDILRKNPRYLTLAKSFDTFFSFGPVLVTPDEIRGVADLSVATVLNGATAAENQVSRMTFPPDQLVAFHSSVMTLLPGDIISTGTPGAVQIRDKDVVSCRISGFSPLTNPVVDLKPPHERP